MPDALRDDEALPRRQLDHAILEVDEERALDDAEGLILVVVHVPVVLALDDTEPQDRITDPARRLVEPRVLDRVGVSCKRLGLQKLIQVKRAAGRPKGFEPIAELELLRDEGEP